MLHDKEEEAWGRLGAGSLGGVWGSALLMHSSIQQRISWGGCRLTEQASDGPVTALQLIGRDGSRGGLEFPGPGSMPGWEIDKNDGRRKGNPGGGE